MSSLIVSTVAQQLSLQLLGDPSLPISIVCPPEDLQRGCTVFLEKQELLSLVDSCASVFLIPKNIFKNVPIDLQKSYLICEHPRKAFVLLLQMVVREKKSCSIPRILPFQTAADTFLQANFKRDCLVSEDLCVGENTTIFEQVLIQHNVTIGKNCVIEPGAKILHNTTIGDNCHIGPNSVIGLNGFGYELIDKKMIRVPQIGTVQIEDDVDIDAHCCIERGTLSATIIGRGTKIGSFVHIGHNCKIGKNCIIITQTGLAGSCTLEEGVILAGQVGVGEHSFVGKHTKVGGKSGIVSRSHIPSNSKIFGTPAIPKQQFDNIHQFLLKKFSLDL